MELRSQQPTSTTLSLHECSICQDTGTINVIERYDTGSCYSDGRPIISERIKVDPATGRPPLCDCMKEKVFEKYNATAGMKPNERNRCFDMAEIDEENRPKFDQARRFVAHIDEHLAAGTWMYIFGDAERARPRGLSEVGTGKSYLTHCIGNELSKLKYRAIYITEDKLFEEIKSTYQRDSEESESDVLFRYQNVPILLIDDLFKSKITDWAEDKLFHLLNNRLTPGKVTIINSNYALHRIELICPKTGPAIASRILGNAIGIEMIGRDRRKKKKKAVSTNAG